MVTLSLNRIYRVTVISYKFSANKYITQVCMHIVMIHTSIDNMMEVVKARGANTVDMISQ